MRNLRLLTGVLALGVAIVATPALAFHDAGVAHCNGCHTMHNSADNPADEAAGNQFLLKQSNSTDTCVRCHDTGYGNTWGTSVDNPGKIVGGGQFVFLLEDDLNDGHGAAIPGHQAGHNVISVDKGTVEDPVNGAAPGGTYVSANMHCTSCHDPHGQGGNFRLLYGQPYDSYAMGYSFAYNVDAPTAAGLSIFSGVEANDSHTAFQAGMSEWCSNCHGDFHNTDYPNTLIHPSGELMDETAANYNMYEGSGTYTGDGSDAYLALVPFEDAGNTTTYVGAAGALTSRVMCLTCHRAHASSGPNSGRWDFNVTLWEEEGVGSGSWPIPNPYAATAGGHQRSLCNKCHAKDPEL